MNTTTELLPIRYLFDHVKDIDYDNISIIGKTNILALCYELQKDIKEREERLVWKSVAEEERSLEVPNTTLLKEAEDNITVKNEMIQQRKLVLEHLKNAAVNADEKPEIPMLRYNDMYPIGLPVMVYIEIFKEYQSHQLLKGWQFGIVTENKNHLKSVEVFFDNPFHDMGWIPSNKHFRYQDLISSMIMKIDDLRMLKKTINNPEEEVFMKLWSKGIDMKQAIGIITEFKEEDYTIDEIEFIYKKVIKEFTKPNYRIKIFEDMLGR